MKEEYALLGTYEHLDRNNIEIIAMSNDYDELTKIKDATEIVNEKLIGIDRESPTDEVEKIIEISLDSVDIRDSVTGYVQDVNITGIFKIEEVEAKIIKKCADCGQVLFVGTEKEARHKIIYCPDCTGSEAPEKNKKIK